MYGLVSLAILKQFVMLALLRNMYFTTELARFLVHHNISKTIIINVKHAYILVNNVLLQPFAFLARVVYTYQEVLVFPTVCILYILILQKIFAKHVKLLAPHA